MDIVEKLAGDGLLTEEQVERIGRNVSEVVKAAQEDPTLLKEAIEKMAIPAPGQVSKGFFDKAFRHAKEYAPWAVGSAIVGGGMTLGSRAAQLAFTSAKDHIQKAKAYEGMLETNPGLKDENPELVQKGFNTLFRFNPQFAQDPLVASTFVKNIVDQERLNLADVKALVDARKAMAPAATGPNFMEKIMPPADIALKMQSSSFAPEPDPSDKASKGRLSATKQETADYEKARAKYRAESAFSQKETDEKKRQEARARAAQANKRWAKDMGL